jgi:hypothetical protein
MGEWVNSNLEADVNSEIDDIKYVLDRIAQMPKKKAERILVYCSQYVNDKKKETDLSGDLYEAKKQLMELIKDGASK